MQRTQVCLHAKNTLAPYARGMRYYPCGVKYRTVPPGEGI